MCKCVNASNIRNYRTFSAVFKKSVFKFSQNAQVSLGASAYAVVEVVQFLPEGYSTTHVFKNVKKKTVEFEDSLTLRLGILPVGPFSHNQLRLCSCVVCSICKKL